jgi:hypothetical protein
MAPTAAIQVRFVENGSVTWTPQAATTTTLLDSQDHSLLSAAPRSSRLQDDSDSRQEEEMEEELRNQFTEYIRSCIQEERYSISPDASAAMVARRLELHYHLLAVLLDPTSRLRNITREALDASGLGLEDFFMDMKMYYCAQMDALLKMWCKVPEKKETEAQQSIDAYMGDDNAS